MSAEQPWKLPPELLEAQLRLVCRYVAGDLSRAERAEFETWLASSPELAAEVEQERRLRRGIANAARRGWLKRNTKTEPSHHRRNMALAVLIMSIASLLVVLLFGPR